MAMPAAVAPSAAVVLAHAGWHEVILLGALPLAVLAVWEAVDRRRGATSRRPPRGSRGRGAPEGEGSHGCRRRRRRAPSGGSRRRPAAPPGTRAAPTAPAGTVTTGEPAAAPHPPACRSTSPPP